MNNVTQADRDAAIVYWGNDNPPLELTRAMCAHRISSCADKDDEIAAFKQRVAELLRLFLPVEMSLAEMEMVAEKAQDEAVILSFMGSGASDSVTYGEYRRVTDAAKALLRKDTAQ